VEETGSVNGLIYVGGTRYNVFSGYNAPLNQWTHAAYTVKQGRMDIYINGKWRAKTDIPVGAFNTNTNPLRIAGQGSDSTQPWFRGLIDEVRIYNRALSEEEIRYLYNRGAPIAHWKFDEGEGNIAYDSSGNGNNGTIYGAQWVQGKFASALSFDGVDDYVEVPNSPSLNPTNEITVEAWFYPMSYTSGTGWHGIVGKAGFTNGYLLWVEETGSVNGLIYVGGTRYNVFSGYNAPLNQWTHAAYTVKQGRMDIYINGQWRAKTDIPVGAFNTNTNPLRIAGQGSDSTQPWFRGLIDDVRIYNYARSPEQILQDYNEGLATHFK
jgi:hypothetical protein